VLSVSAAFKRAKLRKFNPQLIQDLAATPEQFVKYLKREADRLEQCSQFVSLRTIDGMHEMLDLHELASNIKNVARCIETAKLRRLVD
jgi:hypothetical protein